MRLHQFQSGVLVLMTSNNTDEEVRQDLMNQVRSLEVNMKFVIFGLFQLESVGSFTPEEMSRQMNLSVILARERLLSAENEGLYNIEMVKLNSS